MGTHSIDDVRHPTRRQRQRLLPGIAAAAGGALLWAALLHSPWVGVLTFATAAIPRLMMREARAPFSIWLGLAFMIGGTTSAIALLTGHASLP